MVFNVQENAVFIHEFSKFPTAPPTPSPPRSVASLPRVGTPLTKPGCTTVAKRTRAHALAPLIGVTLNNFFKEGRVGGWYMSLHITNTMAFNVQEMLFSYTNFQKNLPTGHTPPPPPPGSVASLPRFGPPLTNHGCTTVIGIAKRHKGPCSPLIGVKDNFKRGNIGDWYMPPHITTP